MGVVPYANAFLIICRHQKLQHQPLGGSSIPRLGDDCRLNLCKASRFPISQPDGCELEKNKQCLIARGMDELGVLNGDIVPFFNVRFRGEIA